MKKGMLAQSMWGAPYPQANQKHNTKLYFNLRKWKIISSNLTPVLLVRSLSSPVSLELFYALSTNPIPCIVKWDFFLLNKEFRFLTDAILMRT